MFTKQHYQKIAETFQSAHPRCQLFKHNRYDELLWESIVSRFANMFEEDNLKFNREKFIEKCNPGSEY